MNRVKTLNILKQIEEMKRIVSNEPNPNKAKQHVMQYLREQKKHVTK